MEKSRFLCLIGLALLVFSTFLPWLSISVGSNKEYLSLTSIRHIREEIIGSNTNVQGSETSLLIDYLPYIMLLMMTISVIASILPGSSLLTGILGVMWSSMILNDPRELLLGRSTCSTNIPISLDIGFYVFFASSFIFLSGGIFALIERNSREKKRFWW